MFKHFKWMVVKTMLVLLAAGLVGCGGETPETGNVEQADEQLASDAASADLASETEVEEASNETFGEYLHAWNEDSKEELRAVLQSLYPDLEGVNDYWIFATYHGYEEMRIAFEEEGTPPPSYEELKEHYADKLVLSISIDFEDPDVAANKQLHLQNIKALIDHYHQQGVFINDMLLQYYENADEEPTDTFSLPGPSFDFAPELFELYWYNYEELISGAYAEKEIERFESGIKDTLNKTPDLPEDLLAWYYAAGEELETVLMGIDPALNIWNANAVVNFHSLDELQSLRGEWDEQGIGYPDYEELKTNYSQYFSISMLVYIADQDVEANKQEHLINAQKLLEYYQSEGISLNTVSVAYSEQPYKYTAKQLMLGPNFPETITAETLEPYWLDMIEIQNQIANSVLELFW